MEAHTNVAESDIGRLKPDMRVTFTVDAYPGDPFRGPHPRHPQRAAGRAERRHL